MEHAIKTSFGILPGTLKWGPYSTLVMATIGTVYTLLANFGGIGQGGGGGPVIWLTIAMILIQIYSKSMSGARVIDPINKSTDIIHVISYVDDNTLVQELKDTMGITEIIQLMQQCIVKWKRLLQITGGDLALQKCELAILKWKWFGGKAVPVSKQMMPGDMMVDHNKLQRKEVHEGYKMLGIRLTMSGDHKEEHVARMKQSKNMGALLYRAPTKPIDAFMIYNTRYLPAIRYPLTVMTFSEKELQEIQKPFVYLLLPKIGLNRHTLRAVVYAPYERGGLNFCALAHEQLVAQVKLMVGHVRRDDLLGRLYRVQMRVVQMELGIEKWFFRQNPFDYEYLTDTSKLVYMWKELRRYNINLYMDKEWTIPKQYQNDINIMDKAISIPALTNMHLK